MRIDILTLFPEMFQGPFDKSIVARARSDGLLQVYFHNIRDYAHDKHRVVDDYTYGGGAGMVMKPEPVDDALAHVYAEGAAEGHDQPPATILLTPQGEPFSQAIARELAQSSWLALLCGHYEGVDERIRQHLVTREISIGDYVLTGGELPAMVLTDAVVRLQPGVMGSSESAEEESFNMGLLEYPQYTRPSDFKGWSVPAILLSGDHAAVAKWRRQQALLRTAQRRPDLLATAHLSAQERTWLREQTGLEL